MVIILIVLSSLTLIVAGVILSALRLQGSSGSHSLQRPHVLSIKDKSNVPLRNHAELYATECDEKNPDVIPSKGRIE
jgi:hypothetical protein